MGREASEGVAGGVSLTSEELKGIYYELTGRGLTEDERQSGIWLGDDELLSPFRCGRCRVRYVPGAAVLDGDWLVCPHCGGFTGL